ncbi:hypothetical protein PC128_g20370 [Phytophthora cactorum]|nr:hypothetical protein PC128_g20370 [Phytophthora cactorum]
MASSRLAISSLDTVAGSINTEKAENNVDFAALHCTMTGIASLFSRSKSCMQPGPSVVIMWAFSKMKLHFGDKSKSSQHLACTQ